MTPFEEGVDPVRLASVLERRDVLERYCAIERPSAEQTARHAEELGVSIGRLYIMAKAWRILPELRGIGGARVKQDRKPKLAGRVVSIIEQAIAIAGAGTSATQIYEKVCTECEDAGIDPPTLSAVHERVMKARSRAVPADCTRRFSVFQCRIDLPVERSGTILAPYITAVIDLPSKRIRNATISMGAPAALERAVESLLEDRTGCDRPTCILVPTKKLPELSMKFVHPLEPAGRGNTSSALLGRRIDILPILHRTYPGADAKLARKTAGRMNSALSEAEAFAIIELAIKAHNHARVDE